MTHGKGCRHFNLVAAFRGDPDACAIGHPILKIVKAANGGSAKNIRRMLPCRPGPAIKAHCPNYDPKTDAEIEAGHEEMRIRMDRFVTALPAIDAIRTSMIAADQSAGDFGCPWCMAPGTLTVRVNLTGNHHMRAHCSACNEGFIE